MIGALGQMLPIALAAALSSVPLTVMIVILLSPRRSSAGLPYLVGSVIGVTLVVALTTLLAQALPESRVRQKDPVVGALEVVFGAVIIVLGIRAWRRRGRPTTERRSVPRWVSAADALGPVRAFGVGLILGFRPKSFLLASVVGLQLHVGGLSTAATAVVGLVYVAVATSTVTVPIVLTLVAPGRMEPRLTRASDLLTAELPLVSGAVLIILGVVVIGAGLQNF